jgi:hypothetical protein
MPRPLDLVPMTSWTIVMTCGVVSIDRSLAHQPVLSAIMLWFAAGVWVFLTGALGCRWFPARPDVARSRVARRTDDRGRDGCALPRLLARASRRSRVRR